MFLIKNLLYIIFIIIESKLIKWEKSKQEIKTDIIDKFYKLIQQFYIYKIICKILNIWLILRYYVFYNISFKIICKFILSIIFLK